MYARSGTIIHPHIQLSECWTSDSWLNTLLLRPIPRRRPVSMSKCQSVSTFSSENLSVSDGEEGNTTDHSHSGTPDVVSTNTDERLDDKSDDLLSQGSEIPADPSDPTQLGSDGLSEKEAILRQVKTQLASNDHSYEVKSAASRGLGKETWNCVLCWWQPGIHQLILSFCETRACMMTRTVTAQSWTTRAV